LGEADFELARMSRAGVIALVLTEDSDAVVFGTVQVVLDKADGVFICSLQTRSG
jgi:hypothetical protein